MNTDEGNVTVIDEKLAKLRALIRDCASAIVAYSGGVDSALVMAVAHEQLGDRALACLGVSPSYPQRERDDAIRLAEARGAKYRLVTTDEEADPRYAANPANRCYFCKSNLFDKLKEIAASEGFAAVFDGNNADDRRATDRPGMTAAAERGVRSPLAEAGITKAEVREISKQLGLPVWDKPAAPCLASRIPTGMSITPQLLARVEAAENVLADLGFREFRVRHHGEVARIELTPQDLPRAVELRQQITAGIRKAGYRFVALDLGGFKSGSLNVLTVAGLGEAGKTGITDPGYKEGATR